MKTFTPREPSDSPRFITIEVACEMSGGTRDTIRAAVNAGHIEAFKYGRRTVRLVRADVVAWMEACRVPVASRHMEVGELR